MTFWLLAAMLTALVTGMIVTPLERQNRRLTFVLTFGIPLLALGIYLLAGNPDLAK